MVARAGSGSSEATLDGTMDFQRRMNVIDYRRSNQRRQFGVDLGSVSVAATLGVLSTSDAADRQRLGLALVSALSDASGVPAPKLVVLDAPRPHRLNADARTVYQRYASYSPRTKTIRVHNRTARRGLNVAPKTFFETLLHELAHHWDFQLLGLQRSLHTSGFYHRLGHMKRHLLAAANVPAGRGPRGRA